MAKQKLKGIKSAYLQHDILKMVFIGEGQEEIPVSIPTLEYLNKRKEKDINKVIDKEG